MLFLSYTLKKLFFYDFSFQDNTAIYDNYPERAQLKIMFMRESEGVY